MKNSNNTLNRKIAYNGIDRLNNKIGYIKENTVSCCKQCNYSKHIMNYDEYIELITKIYLKNVQRPERKLVASSEAKWKTPEKDDDMVCSHK